MEKDKKQEYEKVVTRAKDLYYKYEVMEKCEAGMELLGTEVKSLREGRADLKDSFCRFQGDEIFLMNMHISPYPHGTHANHEPERPRKLLLKKRELVRLHSKVAERGLTIVPARLYFNRAGKAKIEIALVKGKKLYDRRETLKRKTQEREMEREMKKYK